MKQFLIFVRKEWYHIWRDKRTLLILIGMPIIQIVLYGFALTNEIKNSRIAVLDESHDPSTLALIQKIDASRYFEITRMLHSPADVEAVFRQGRTRLVIIFPLGFRGDLLHGHRAQVQLVADASDPNTANMLTNYAEAIINDYQQSLNGDQALPYQIS
ncbi:MAG: ABC transporter permease, partial [Bacteroidota bacterium]|nr:ABC transporter permease [Bacteroidota bacterium]